MIEDVEEFAAETKPHFLDKLKLPLKGDIGLPRSKTAQYIASEIPLLTGGRSDSPFEERQTVLSSTRDARRPVSTPSRGLGVGFGIALSLTRRRFHRR